VTDGSGGIPGRVLMVGIPGPRLDAETRDALDTLSPGGVIIFRRNIESPADLAVLVGDLLEAMPPPTLIAIDQEGGRVSRLEPWIGPTPTAAALADDAGGSAFRLGRATALGLRALGVNLDFAPVVDLCEPDARNGIGDRSFGTDAAVAARHAGSFLDGLQKSGVAGCLKHFPGLGDTTVDSHEVLPTVHRDRHQLEDQDFRPYRLLAKRAASVMVGHGHYPALDPQPGLPATLSHEIVQGCLRGQVGFGGLVASDDMEMGAVADLDRDGSAAVAAVAAGCDLVLYCADLERAARAHRALDEVAAGDPSFRSRLEAAATSVIQTAARWPAARPDVDAWENARREIWAASRIA
jgi:beta-N-acetylhexosaminidase